MPFFPIPAVKAARGGTSATRQRPRACLGRVFPQSSAPSWRQDVCVGVSPGSRGHLAAVLPDGLGKREPLESTEPPCCAPGSGFLNFQEPTGHGLACLSPGLGHGWPLGWTIGSTWPSLLNPLVSLTSGSVMGT